MEVKYLFFNSRVFFFKIKIFLFDNRDIFNEGSWLMVLGEFCFRVF